MPNSNLTSSAPQLNIFDTLPKRSKMLPPVEPEIATANPKFDALYRDLCSNKISDDGTSKIVDVNVQKERDAFDEVPYLAIPQDSKHDS